MAEAMPVQFLSNQHLGKAEIAKLGIQSCAEIEVGKATTTSSKNDVAFVASSISYQRDRLWRNCDPTRNSAGMDEKFDRVLLVW